jgi:type IV pilus assembly protein PilB
MTRCDSRERGRRGSGFGRLTRGRFVIQKIGSILVEQGLLRADQLETALAEQRRVGGKLGSILQELGLTSPLEIAEGIARQANVEVLDLDTVDLEPEAVALIPESLARKYDLVPLHFQGEQLVIAMASPLNIVAIDEVQGVTRYRISVVGAPEDQVARMLNRAYQTKPEGELEVVVERARSALSGETESDRGVVELVDYLIEMAARREATDLHVEPGDNGLHTRLRIDGELTRGPTLPRDLAQPIASRIKIMAHLDIVELRIPQDGKIRFEGGGLRLDLRVSTFPTVLGESIVVRILDRARTTYALEHLGLESRDVEILCQAAQQPSGMILVTGATGSGKTTTLYSLMGNIDSQTRKALTLEDPVECDLASVLQCQINEKMGITFAKTLRASLRHDPDVILVGEMRDPETAMIAMRAALTGHLVMSTTHTSGAVAALARLRDLGVEPYLISSCLRIVVAQRLIRRLCRHCCEEYQPNQAEAEAFGVPAGESFSRSAGCDLCEGRGTRGRSAIFELFEITPEIGALILEQAPEEVVRERARSSGMRGFRSAALEKARQGSISLQEFARITAEV